MMMMNYRCSRCGHSHQASTCTLKAPCKTCIQRHLERRETFKLQPIADVLYLDCPTYNHKVLLKVSEVIIRNGVRSLEAYAVLDHGFQWTILLHAAKKLGLHNEPDVLDFCIIYQEIQVFHGAAVSFILSPAAELKRRFKLNLFSNHREITAQLIAL